MKTNRKRPQLTVKQLMEFLTTLPPECKLYYAPSMLNIDEPPMTQEFIDTPRSVIVVSIEYLRRSKRVTIGWKEQE